jgi:ribosomal protein S18 acetylase RimI-like enzyme
MEYHIREATLNDLSSIVTLWNELMAFHIKLDSSFEVCEDAEQKFREFLKGNIESSNKSVVFVAEVLHESEKKIVGYLMAFQGTNPPVFKIQHFGEISDICVTSSYRRNGIGKALYLHVKEWFFKRGYERLELQAAVRNTVSIPFWKSMGFTPILEKMYLNK